MTKFLKHIKSFGSTVLLFLGVSMAQEASNKGEKPAMQETAVFAMGCFWCGESEFRDHTTHEPLSGILSVRVGYAGGTAPNPTYENHHEYQEAVKIVFDPSVISYERLLDIFWHNVDFLDGEGQFCDKGDPYKSTIFYANDQQKKQAEVAQKKIEESFKQPVKTTLIQMTSFYDAEEYHQNYQSKNPVRYKFYRWNCGRDQRLKEIWKE